ncbi:hypothetical protein EV175_002732 [Coemansia sp. RSA 1933]|nr:hypothetical protein EV175_002732 [Coemansia sp. RSA 1933]
MSFMQRLADRKQIIIGTILTPLGIYGGIRLKQWNDEKEAARIEREVEFSAKPPHVDHDGPDSPAALNAELDDLRKATQTIRAREGQLIMEIESINVKLQRLEAKIERNNKNNKS